MTQKKEKKVLMSVYVDESFRDMVAALAKKERRPLSQMASIVIQRGMRNTINAETVYDDMATHE